MINNNKQIVKSEYELLNNKHKMIVINKQLNQNKEIINQNSNQ